MYSQSQQRSQQMRESELAANRLLAHFAKRFKSRGRKARDIELWGRAPKRNPLGKAATGEETERHAMARVTARNQLTRWHQSRIARVRCSAQQRLEVR